MTAFYLGDGVVRTSFFQGLEADVLVMTMPDLETFHIKRSKSHPVHYAYVFHSLVSTNMVYRTGAFDHFDTLLCSGPHHAREIRATEAAYGLKPKSLVEHGYGRLDSILAAASQHTAPNSTSEKLRVLVAPSWGPKGLIETRGVELTRILLDSGFHATLRPHPMTGKKHPEALRALEREFGTRPDFELETNVASQESLHTSNLMICDWSGVALEYLFGLERPVLFIDVPRKINNPEYEKIDCEPFEVSVRSEAGEVVALDRLHEVPDAVRRLCADPAVYRERIRGLRSEMIYNVGTSGQVGAKTIAALADAARDAKGKIQ